MKKETREVIIDSDFLNKVTLAPNVLDGKDLFIRTMNEMNVKPVTHYYLANREMTVKNEIAKELIDEEYIKVYQKNQIVHTQEQEEQYKNYFRKWYNYLNSDYGRLEKDVDVFTLNRARRSLGEIHCILMAYMLNLDYIYSDDGDAKDLVDYSGIRNIKVYNIVDVYSIIGQKEKKEIELSEVEHIIRGDDSSESIKNRQNNKKKFNKVKNVWKIESVKESSDSSIPELNIPC